MSPEHFKREFSVHSYTFYSFKIATTPEIKQIDQKIHIWSSGHFLSNFRLCEKLGKEFMMILYRQLRFVHSLFSEEAKISMNIWGFAIVGLSAYSLGHKN